MFNNIIHLDGPDKTGKDTQRDMLVKRSEGKYLVIVRSYLSQIVYSRIYNRDINENFFWDKLMHAYHVNGEQFYVLSCTEETAKKRFIDANEKDIHINEFLKHLGMFFEVVDEANEKCGVDIKIISTNSNAEYTYRNIQYHILSNDMKTCNNCALHLLPENEQNFLYGTGKLIPNAVTYFPKYMFVGMNPSRNRICCTEQPFAITDEEDKNEVFINILKTLDIYNDSYFTNIVKCSTANNKINNQNVRDCNEHIFNEIEVFKPEVIVALGTEVHKQLLALTPSIEQKIVKIHHPSYQYSYNGITPNDYHDQIKLQILG